MLSSNSVTYWFQFFLDAGIPADDAGRYAGSFSSNRISPNMASDLTKTYLEQLGITTLGDCIAVLKHAKNLFAKEISEKSNKSSFIPKPTNTVNLKKSVEVPSTKKPIIPDSMDTVNTSESILINSEISNETNVKNLLTSTNNFIVENTLESADGVVSKGSSKTKNLSKSKKVASTKDHESSDDEMCYVEHKTVSAKLANHSNIDREKDIKKTTKKRSLPYLGSREDHCIDKKSVFERLGHEKIEQKRIANNKLDINSVFKRLGSQAAKKRKVSVIIDNHIYETTESSDDSEHDDDKQTDVKSENSFKSPVKTISAGVLSNNCIQPNKFIKSSEGIFSPNATSEQLSIAKRLGRRIPEKIVIDKIGTTEKAVADESKSKVELESKRLARFVKAEIIRGNYQEKTLENQAKKLKVERLFVSNLIGPDRLSKGGGTMQMDKSRVQVFDRLGCKI